MRPSWIYRGANWRTRHLLRCDGCYKRFADDTPGAIDAQRANATEAEQCLPFGGHTEITMCPACAAPLWEEAVSVAPYRQGWR